MAYKADTLEELRKKNNAFNLEWRRKNKIAALSGYSKDGIPRCSCCGETTLEFLTIDHVNKDGGQERKKSHGGGKIHRKIIKEGWPDIYRVLCFNCNCSYGFFGYCPHQKDKL